MPFLSAIWPLIMELISRSNALQLIKSLQSLITSLHSRADVIMLMFIFIHIAAIRTIKQGHLALHLALLRTKSHSQHIILSARRDYLIGK